MNDMTHPTPSAIALAVDGLLTTFIAQITAPLIARIEVLEAQGVAAFQGDEFNAAVVVAICDRPLDVCDALTDELQERLKESKAEHIRELVTEVIRGGSFSITFDRY